MDERLEFVTRVLDGEKIAALCREFGISRKPGHKIISRARLTSCSSGLPPVLLKSTEPISPRVHTAPSCRFALMEGASNPPVQIGKRHKASASNQALLLCHRLVSPRSDCCGHSRQMVGCRETRDLLSRLQAMIAILEPENFDALRERVAGYLVFRSKLVAGSLADQGRSAQLCKVPRAKLVWLSDGVEGVAKAQKPTDFSGRI